MPERKIAVEMILVVALAGITPTLSGQQAERAPALAPGVAPPRIQSNRATAQRPAAPGVIEGLIYWDADTIKHFPPNSCSGLSVTVSVGETLLVTMTDNFAYMGSVGSDAVCRYAVKGLPVGQDLQVQTNVTAETAFLPAALPSGGSRSIKIMGGSALCNNLPPAVPSSVDLSRNWWTCPNYAYNVNFVLARAPGSSSSRVAGPVRVAPGTAVELSPQPYPPKNETLLAPGAQKTLLGTQPNSPQPGNGTLTVNGGTQANWSPTGGTLAVNGSPQQGTSVGGSLAVNGSPQGSSRGGALAVNGAPQQSVSGQTVSAQVNAGSNAGSSPIPSKGQGRTEYEPMTVERGVTQDKAFANWANSGHAPVAIQENPNVYVAQACAKDPSFRILLVSGAPDGKTLTVGPQYTIWGCSFGNMPAVKRPAPPVTSRSQNQTRAYPSYYNVSLWTSQPFIDIDAHTVSWSDNAIVVTFPPRPANHPGPSTAGADPLSQLLVTRGDGQTRIYGSEGGLYFRLTN